MAQMASGAKLIKVKSVMATNAIANTQDFSNWIKNEYDFKNDGTFYFMLILGNSSTSAYKAISAVRAQKSTECWIFARDANTTSAVNTGWIFDITPSSTVEIYEIVV